MNKNSIIAGAAVAVVILIMVMAFSGGSNPAPGQSEMPTGGQSTESVIGPPIPDRSDFRIYFAKYLEGNCPDPTRITATLKQNPSWVQDVLPENFDSAYAAMKARTYTIIFPFVSAEDIKRTRLLQAVVGSEKKPRDVVSLIEMGANINEPGVITRAFTTEMLEYLLVKGADPNVPNENGSLTYDLHEGELFRAYRLILEKHGGHGKSQ